MSTVIYDHDRTAVIAGTPPDAREIHVDFELDNDSWSFGMRAGQTIEIFDHSADPVDLGWHDPNGPKYKHGPKGGRTQRIAKRRTRNKAARKARRK